MSRTLGDPREVGPLGMSKDQFLSNHHCQRTLLRVCAAPVIMLALGSLAPCVAQERLGKPLIHNYSRRDFGAEVQHWDVIQDRRGVMYFANNAGVLEYDGRTWRLIELPSRLGVQSLAMDDAGRIYVGARGDFGYLGADALGQLEFISLLPSEARKDPSFDQLFTPIPTPSGDVYFQARTKLCHFDSTLACREMESVSQIFSAGGRLYVQQDAGLMQLVRGSLQPVPGGERFTRNEITVLLAYSLGDREGILVGTRAWELFRQRGESFEPLRSSAAEQAGGDELLDGAVLQDGSFALATMLRGVIIVDPRGAVLQQIDQASGLQDNHVHAVLPDSQGGLWLGLQKGVSRVEVASPFTAFDEGSGLEREWREVVEHDETLYVRGYKGLFAARLTAPRSLRFHRIADIEPPAWSFVSTEGRLLVSSRDAVHEVHGQRSRRVVTYASVPRTLYRSRLDPRRVYVGLSEGVASLRLTDGVWRDEGRIDGIDETITSIAEGESGALWLVSLRQRVIRIDFTEPLADDADRRPNLRSRRVTAYPLGEEALTGRISIHEAAGRPLFVTDSGIVRFDEAAERFVPFANLAILADAGRRSFSWITEDARGN
ncbi:MAG: two-component regulator propeller domain-containing protein, partial [Vicinamibacteraceae bacterium]